MSVLCACMQYCIHCLHYNALHCKLKCCQTVNTFDWQSSPESVRKRLPMLDAPFNQDSGDVSALRMHAV